MFRQNSRKQADSALSVAWSDTQGCSADFQSAAVSQISNLLGVRLSRALSQSQRWQNVILRYFRAERERFHHWSQRQASRTGRMWL